MELGTKASIDSMDHLSESWCNSAIQVFEPSIRESSIMPLDTGIMDSDTNLSMEDGESMPIPPWKLNDIQSWIWLQQAIHPELSYDPRFKKWLSRKSKSAKRISLKEWLREMKQKRKEDERLRKAAVHAAISVAGVAAALAAIAAENTSANQPKSSRETAVASAAALVAAQCALVAEAAGAKRDQLAAAIDAATTTTDASNIITLTAAAATSLKGAATLRGRPAHRERMMGSAATIMNEGLDCDYGMCRALLAKGNDLLVRTPDGKCRFRSVSIALNMDGKVILKIKKLNLLMVFSSAKESIVYTLHSKPFKDSVEEDVMSYSIHMETSKGNVELNIDNYVQYRKWTMTIYHMLMLSTTFTKYGNTTLKMRGVQMNM